VNRKLSTAAIIVVSFGIVGAAKSAGNVAAGKARSVVCAGCHGVQGEGLPPTPRLAGIPQDQQVKALKDYKSGARANAVMKGLAALLSDKDMEDVSAYYATLTPAPVPAPVPTPPTTPAPSAAPTPTTAPARSSPRAPSAGTAKSVGGVVGREQRTGGPTRSRPDAEVYFVDLKDGATVPAKVTLYFGLRNMGIAPAGSDRENSGHHHLLIDTDLPPLNQPIPSDFNHLHFGAGQTETEITLKPGEHILQLLMGDKDHIPHTPPVMSQRIKVRVAGDANAGLTGGPSTSAPGAEVYFIDLKDGATIGPKTMLYFGLKNMGIAPAGSDREKSGHHHLLIDTELPPLDEPIPSDFNHLHLGAGQTDAEITLKAGMHTLQLLLGDKDHIPHTPPVTSQKIHVRVVDPSLRKASPPDARVSFVGLQDGAVLPPKATIHFGLSNMGVAPAGIEKPNTGHHHLLIDTKLPDDLNEPIPSDFNHLHFGAGQTEAEIMLKAGMHTLQLLLGDENHVPHNPPVMSKPIRVLVTRTGR
jgi:cytochrome c553